MQTSRVVAGGVIAAAVAVIAFAIVNQGSEDDAAQDISAATAAETDAEGADSDSSDPDAADSDSADSDSADSDSADSDSADSDAAEEEEAIPEPENYGPRPPFIGITGWMNTDLADPETIFDDGVTVVQMWTFGCYNCKNTLPHMRELYADNHDRGLEIIGVHAPEFDYEADEGNIAAALVDLDVTWPVALDPEKKTFRKWQEGGRRAWPRVFVIDQNGDVRYDHTGEGHYDDLTEVVEYLLDNPA